MYIYTHNFPGLELIQSPRGSTGLTWHWPRPAVLQRGCSDQSLMMGFCKAVLSQHLGDYATSKSAMSLFLSELTLT